MIVFTVLAFTLQVSGIICIAIAYTMRNPEYPFISFKNPADPRRWGFLFRTVAGHRFAMVGGLLLAVGGLLTVIASASEYFLKQ